MMQNLNNNKNFRIYYLKFKKRILHHLANQLAGILYTIKKDHQFPIQYPIVWMFLSEFFIEQFITEHTTFSTVTIIMLSTVMSLIFASALHLFSVLYIHYNMLPDEKRMEKFFKFIRDHRENPVIKK